MSPSEAVGGPMAVIEMELVTLARRLETLSRRSSVYEHVDRAGYLVLRTLATGPLRTTQVAEALQLDTSTATRQVRVLESAGLVGRRADRTDGRATQLELSGAGRRAMAEVERRRHALLASLLADWTPEEEGRLARALVKFNAALTTYAWEPSQ